MEWADADWSGGDTWTDADEAWPMPEHDTPPQPHGIPWKLPVGGIGLSGAGLASGLGIANATPEQIAYAGMAWSMAAVAAIVGWVANVITTRRYVHVAELIAAREQAAREVAAALAAAVKREAELTEDRDYWRHDSEHWRDQALRSGRVAEIAVPAAVAQAHATPTEGERRD